eukprot:comp22363_c0_seq1/m.33321 comp22363_c0_seq1/g.33321  ORF comp22363_c0_seq1/g.33321 comp22363_c0_seq1/m.33321 type:complete len:418 (-) comp22363_c0_seq1:391-1644(-)
MVKKTVQVLLAALAGVQATPLHLKTSVEDGVSSLLLEASSEFVKAATHVVKGMGSVSMATDLLVTRQAVDAIHSAQNYWTAVDPEDVDNVFHNWTVSRFRSILNRAHDVPKATNANDGPERLVEFFNQPNHKLPIRKIRGNFTALPKSFDSREKWYDCQSVHMIRDQGECGACWAFGTTSAMSDRTCIHSNGKIQDILAARDLMSCCPYCANDGGCNGGWPEDAYTYWHEYGLVTGDNHGSMLGCQPYPIPISLYHGKNNSAVKDTNGRYINSPECVRKCTNEIYTRRNFTTDKIKAKSTHALQKTWKTSKCACKVPACHANTQRPSLPPPVRTITLPTNPDTSFNFLKTIIFLTFKPPTKGRFTVSSPSTHSAPCGRSSPTGQSQWAITSTKISHCTRTACTLKQQATAWPPTSFP